MGARARSEGGLGQVYDIVLECTLWRVEKCEELNEHGDVDLASWDEGWENAEILR